ncbi:MAG: hydrogenase expression/formation protein HypE [Bacteroidota bacterium]
MSEKLSMTLQCPMPELDYDVVTLGHGSGGLLTNKLLDQTIFELLHNTTLDTRHDGAILEGNGQMAFSTDSFVISPIFFPGGNIGELAVNGTVNDVAMCGAVPKYISLGLILEEGLPMEELWEVLLGIKLACEKAGVIVATGDTKVVERGKGDKVFINTTGIGEMHPRANIAASNIEVDDKIIVNGDIATHGMAIMAKRHGMTFDNEIESDTANLNHTIISLIEEFGDDIHLVRDPTRGGLAATLNEISRDIGKGIEIQQTEIPVDSRVDNVCEMLGLDPLYVANEGVFAAFVKAEVADQYLNRLKTLEYGQNAAIIGEVVEEHPGKVVLQSAIGGKRVVNMAVGEQLPRIC